MGHCILFFKSCEKREDQEAMPTVEVFYCYLSFNQPVWIGAKDARMRIYRLKKTRAPYKCGFRLEWIESSYIWSDQLVLYSTCLHLYYRDQNRTTESMNETREKYCTRMHVVECYNGTNCLPDCKGKVDFLSPGSTEKVEFNNGRDYVWWSTYNCRTIGIWDSEAGYTFCVGEGEDQRQWRQTPTRQPWSQLWIPHSECFWACCWRKKEATRYCWKMDCRWWGQYRVLEEVGCQ